MINKHLLYLHATWEWLVNEEALPGHWGCPPLWVPLEAHVFWSLSSHEFPIDPFCLSEVTSPDDLFPISRFGLLHFWFFGWEMIPFSFFPVLLTIFVRYCLACCGVFLSPHCMVARVWREIMAPLRRVCFSSSSSEMPL